MCDIGIVWNQLSEPSPAELEFKPPQRLVNMLAIGLPVVAYAGYNGVQDVALGSELVVLAKDQGELCEAVVEFCRNSSLRKRASVEALEIAKRYSPEAVGTRYIHAFRFFSGKGSGCMDNHAGSIAAAAGVGIKIAGCFDLVKYCWDIASGGIVRLLCPLSCSICPIGWGDS